MNKYQYLIRNTAGLSDAAFSWQIIDMCVPRLKSMRIEGIRVLMSTPHPRLTILPLQAHAAALVSIWGKDATQPNPERITEILRETGCDVHGYSVTESPFVTGARNWPAGSISPGLVLLTVFRKKPSLSREEFMRIWFTEHSPLALTIHPLYNYLRNVVEETIVEGSKPLDSIVEEHFYQDRQLLNPVTMFGGAVRCIPNMLKVYRHVRTFIDMTTIENWICKELDIFRSGK